MTLPWKELICSKYRFSKGQTFSKGKCGAIFRLYATLPTQNSNFKLGHRKNS